MIKINFCTDKFVENDVKMSLMSMIINVKCFCYKSNNF